MPSSQIERYFGGEALGLAEAHILGLAVPQVHLLGDVTMKRSQQTTRMGTSKPKRRPISQSYFQMNSKRFPLASTPCAPLPNTRFFGSQLRRQFWSRLDIPEKNHRHHFSSLGFLFSSRFSSYTQGETILRMGVIIQPNNQGQISPAFAFPAIPLPNVFREPPYHHRPIERRADRPRERSPHFGLHRRFDASPRPQMLPG